MATKYPGVVSVVIPLGIAVLFGVRGATRQRVTLATVFSVGVAISVGPWLLKNVAQTGNPVYRWSTPFSEVSTGTNSSTRNGNVVTAPIIIESPICLRKPAT